MTNGIYGFWDKIKGYFAYIGRFTGIQRVKSHSYPSTYDAQQINRVLQNNPDRYEERILMEGDYNDWQLNQMEKLCIKYFKTFKYDYPERSVFNFTRGAGGISGYKKPYEDFEYTVSKRGFKNGKQKYTVLDRNNNPIKQSVDKDFIADLVDKLNNGEITEEEAKNAFKYTVAKKGFTNGKQNYTVYDRNHNPIKSSIDKNKLELIADALNNGEITEEEIKVVRGVNKVLEMLGGD